MNGLWPWQVNLWPEAAQVSSSWSPEPPPPTGKIHCLPLSHPSLWPQCCMVLFYCTDREPDLVTHKLEAVLRQPQEQRRWWQNFSLKSSLFDFLMLATIFLLFPRRSYFPNSNSEQGTRPCCKHFIEMVSFTPHHNPMKQSLFHLHFTDEKSVVQRH